MVAVSVWRGLRPLRSLGLIAVGIADNSVIPMPGSMDVLTIWRAASEPQYGPFYAFMATVGALIGGYIPYALARKGGKEAFERKLKKKQAEKLYRRFKRGDSAPWPCRLFYRLHFLSCRFCSPQALCSIREKDSSQHWLWDGRSDSPYWPAWERSMGMRLLNFFPTITSRPWRFSLAWQCWVGSLHSSNTSATRSVHQLLLQQLPTPKLPESIWSECAFFARIMDD